MDEKKKGVVNTPAKIKKDKPWEKLLSSFLATDASNLGEYLINDVAIPLIKRGISSTVDMLLYGKTRDINSTGTFYINGGKTTSYNTFYQSPNKSISSQSSLPKTRETSGYHNLAFETRGDAELVLNGMQEYIENFGIVSAGDMYEMAKVPTDNYTLNDYGWTNLNDVGIVRDGGAYVINLPRPSLIK